MSVIAAISSEALRASLEQAIDGLELELVYPRQTGAALTNPALRLPGKAKISNWADLKYLFSLSVGLSTAGSPPADRPPLELDDAGRIHLHQIGINLKQCVIKLALVFDRALPSTIPYSLPLNLPISIPIPNPLSSMAAISSGNPLDVFRDPFSHANLLGDMLTDLFGVTENGLALSLDLAPGKIAEISLHLKPEVRATTRKEKTTLPDGSEVEEVVDYWGLTFDEVVVTGILTALSATLTKMLIEPLQSAVIDSTVEALAGVVMLDPVFLFTHLDWDVVKDYFSAGGEEALAVGEWTAATAAEGLAEANLVADDAAIVGAKAGEVSAHVAYETTLATAEPVSIGIAYGAWQLAKAAVTAAEDKKRLDQQLLDKAKQEVHSAEQKMADAKQKLQDAQEKLRDPARQAIRPLVEEFFKTLDKGMDLLLTVLNVVEDSLTEGALSWLEAKIALASDPNDGLLAQVGAFIREKLTFSLVPKTLSLAVSDKIPAILQSRLKLLPLEAPVTDPPILSISKRELSVAVELGQVL